MRTSDPFDYIIENLVRYVEIHAEWNRSCWAKCETGEMVSDIARVATLR